MQISLSKNSEVPVRQQLAQQIIFLIATGRLRKGQQLPSVRTLARQLKIHYNTVSEAYQDLVFRNWLTRKRGTRLIVGAPLRLSRKQPSPGLDELINETILRARQMGYPLQILRKHVHERLLVESPDHILVVEEEAALGAIISREIQEALGLSVEVCTPEQLAKEPELAVGSQVVAPDHAIENLAPVLPRNRPAIPITFSEADEYLALIRGLKEPSLIVAVSVSKSMLQTAKGLLASAIGRRHSFHEYLASTRGRLDLRTADLAFCDSLTMSVVRCPRKIHYKLIGGDCLAYLASSVDLNRRGLTVSDDDR
jgi:GntR family transcriptional regulator